MDRISTPWLTVCLAQLLSRCVVTEGTPFEGEGAGVPEKNGVDTVIEMGSSTHVGQFQTEILEGKISQAPMCDTHVMVTPVGQTELKQDRGHQLPPRLQVLHTYTTIMAGCKQISIVVWNMTDQAIFLKKGARVAHIVSATLAFPEETPTQGEDDAHAPKEHMTVQEWQDKLLEKLNLDGLSEWTPHNASIARELLLSYHDAFALEPDKQGCMCAIEHEICLSDEEPFKERFRRIPPPLLDEVRAFLRDMLEAGTIRPSQSPWCNAIVLVRKKDGSLRFCIDFRRLNAQTKKDSYPLLRIQEVLESMAGVAHFSTMDFKSGFWQVRMTPESQQYTAFTVGNLGFYEFMRMPFGLCNTPATFQCLMQNMLGELNLTYCIIYLDDVIVYGRMEEEHLKRLRIVLERFREFNLKLKPSKCSFFQSEIVYLAHHVSKEGICPSDENIQHIILPRGTHHNFGVSGCAKIVMCATREDDVSPRGQYASEDVDLYSRNSAHGHQPKGGRSCADSVRSTRDNTHGMCRHISWCQCSGRRSQ